MFEFFWKATAINLLAFIIYFSFLNIWQPDPERDRVYYTIFAAWLLLTVASVFAAAVWFIIRL